ncbi:VOC family protein [Streptomyces roseolus]|uniref:VOC family protein n=1 Tax=Streptomyces roseolus TaxID=67358 RepID=UPI003651CD1E
MTENPNPSELFEGILETLMVNARVVNFKLVVSDLERSLAFYTGLFGLREAVRLEFGDPDVEEIVLEDASGSRPLVLLHGDVMPAPSVPGWTPIVFQVDDVQVAAEAVRRAGYELAVEPIDFGTVSIVMAADPDGYLVEIVAGEIDNLPSTPAGQRVPHPVPHIHEPK